MRESTWNYEDVVRAITERDRCPAAGALYSLLVQALMAGEVIYVNYPYLLGRWRLHLGNEGTIEWQCVVESDSNGR